MAKFGRFEGRSRTPQMVGPGSDLRESPLGKLPLGFPRFRENIAKFARSTWISKLVEVLGRFFTEFSSRMSWGKSLDFRSCFEVTTCSDGFIGLCSCWLSHALGRPFLYGKTKQAFQKLLTALPVTPVVPNMCEFTEKRGLVWEFQDAERLSCNEPTPIQCRCSDGLCIAPGNDSESMFITKILGQPYARKF